MRPLVAIALAATLVVVVLACKPAAAPVDVECTNATDKFCVSCTDGSSCHGSSMQCASDGHGCEPIEPPPDPFVAGSSRNKAWCDAACSSGHGAVTTSATSRHGLRCRCD